jgi:D-3-phosphoglycerate dehydrogenase
VDSDHSPTVLRLSALSAPMIDEERDVLATIAATVIEIEGADDAEIIANACDADAVQIVGTYLRAPVIRELTRCKVISRHGVGVDKIDVGQATQQGILVTNVPDFATEEVADHTMALLLASARRLKDHERHVRQGSRPLLPPPSMHRLSTLTLGLIGLGNIGQAVAVRARACRMRVIAYDKYLPASPVDEVETVDLETLFRQSDILSLHCPLVPETHKMITMEQLMKMKPDAILINTGRGELINEDHLVVALREGIISYAALDVFASINVFDVQGFPTDHPLFELDNVLLTPHIAARSWEATVESRVRGAQAVIDVLSGKWPIHVLNPEVQPWFTIERKVVNV